MLEPKCVLIVEDEPIIGVALEEILEAIGCQTAGIAVRVMQALDLLASTRVDAAILDVNLHGEQSYPVADALADRGIPYIFATGYGDREHPQRHKQAPTVTKPYSLVDIRDALGAVI